MRLGRGFNCLIAVLAVGAGGRWAAADDWSRHYSLSGTAQLKVVADDASVTVTGGEGRQIEARVVTEGWTIGADGVKVTDRQNGDRVELEVRVPHGRVFSFGHRSVKIDLRVPREAELDVHTGDGSISARELAGRIRLETGDGSISLMTARGDIHLASGDGSISADHLEGSLEATTGDGSMKVSGRFDGLSLNTGDGSIQATVESGSKLGKAWTLQSGDGSITIRLPEGIDADLDAHTGDGHIQVDLPVMMLGRAERTTVRGKLGNGGPALTVRSGDGSIQIGRP